ncbi:uncharacterized protein LOC109864040 [Pseudomyrmex gracilis]|uniref:uncharacterized protein LOC109864040 n=1 Tax=Pseudomyrmex gracilis TaxID=219809 RepID=UPI0009950E93|nr:uncharacterized protein LOC109864040 [Pseudomyrmex gracilis]
MRKILLATTLLSIVMCENILLENHPRSKELWIRNNQFWSKKLKQAPQNDFSSKLEEFLNRNDDKQLSRMLETRFISEPRKFPVTIIRRSDSTQFSQDDLLPFDKSKLKRIKPAILISIGIQEEETKAGDSSKEDCSMKKGHRKHNHSWQIQKPFYVEEPKWISIDPEYIDGTTRRLDDADPYILSRGKKIFRLKDPKQMDKLIEDNEEFFDYLSRNKRSSTKYRAKRFVETSENFRSNAVDQKNNRKEKINHYGFFQSIDHGTKRKKDNFANNTNKRNKRSTSLKSKQFSEAYEKNRTYELDSMKSEEGVKRNETYVFEQMMEKIYDKLDDLRNAYDDSFILSHGKHTFDNRTENLNKKSASYRESTYEKPWKNTYSETSESKRENKNKRSILEIEKSTTEKTDSQLTHISAKISGKNIDPNHREKRDACKSPVCKTEPQLPDQWLLKSFGEEIQDTLALERRDKTSEFLNKLIEPSFVISRGKKASKFENDPYSMFQSRNNIKMMRFPLARSLLQMLLMKRCNNSNECDIDASKLVDRRDRRGALDDIFAEEEPFYVGRGKRMKLDSFLRQPLQRKNINSLERDVKQ